MKQNPFAVCRRLMMRYSILESDNASPCVMCVYSVKMFTTLESTVTGKTTF